MTMQQYQAALAAAGYTVQAGPTATTAAGQQAQVAGGSNSNTLDSNSNSNTRDCNSKAWLNSIQALIQHISSSKFIMLKVNRPTQLPKGVKLGILPRHSRLRPGKLSLETELHLILEPTLLLLIIIMLNSLVLTVTENEKQVDIGCQHGLVSLT
nr:hypothetical protein MACL_00003497 [Theileria orientalis]